MANDNIEGINIKTKRRQNELETTVNVSGTAAQLLRGAAGATTRRVALQRAEEVPTADQALWTAIRNRTGAIGFQAYADFIDRVLCARSATETHEKLTEDELKKQTPAQFQGVDAFHLLKVATEAFLVLECGVMVKPGKDPTTGEPSVGENTEISGEESRLGEPLTFKQATDKLTEYLGTGKLPYLTRIVDSLFGDASRRIERSPFCDAILLKRWSAPCLLELIWSYWHEEGMLVQTLNAISMRFQNRHGAQDRDPLMHLQLDPLRPLANIIWGYIQDEIHRLTLARRVYEYDHQYGLTLIGKAVPQLHSVDSRSKFLEGFHNLLHTCSVFFKEDDDTTVISDAFPVLNALREVHLVLAQGAHNQFGDLPWTARVEMLIQQWMLSRPEVREYLGAPPMVPYQEPWMGAVDTMKAMQGWSDVPVSHFRDLGVYGEQLLLSVRYGDWIVVNDPQQARNWARYWRPEIQAYMHSYRVLTGVDLTAEITDTRLASERDMQPSLLQFRRIETQRSRRNGELSAPAGRLRTSLPAPAARDHVTTR
jgi:hypothetical protein